MFCELHPFWCTVLGKFTILIIVVAIAYGIYWLVKEWKKFNQPTVIENNINDSYRVESKTESVNTEEQPETEEVKEATEEPTDEEEFTIDLDDEFAIWLKAIGLKDSTYGSIITDFFKLKGKKEVSILGYDPEDNFVWISMTLHTSEMVSYRVLLTDIDFFQNNELQKPIMEAIFTDDFLETEFEVNSDMTLKENLLAINWDNEVFDRNNVSSITIYISETQYQEMFKKRV